MKNVIKRLQDHPQVSGYKLNIHQKESCELFFVKGKLETVRHTDTCDREVTVYVAHGAFLGDARFFIYPSTTDSQVAALLDEAVTKAQLINNKPYQLPKAETGHFAVESNFASFGPMELASQIADGVFHANTVENAALNAVEVFINKHTETVINSNGLEKTQVRYDAMVETIPTYNGEVQSVELYHQYNFSAFQIEEVRREIARKMAEVKGRYEAVVPENISGCKVILCELELSELFRNIAYDLNYGSVYAHSNLFHKGDAIQKAPTGDLLGITMAGAAPGCVRSARFDGDGVALGSIRIVDGGKAVNYFGSNRYGQYLGETPTGDLRCICVDAGSAQSADLAAGPYLEVLSMSGLQVDFYNDYIGGEVRLAYYHDGTDVQAVTGISISGKLSQVLDSIRLSAETAVHGSYTGPRQAILSDMKIF